MTLLAVGLAAAILAVTALFVGWFAVRPADNILGGYTGSSAMLTAVPLVVTAACLAAATALYFRRPRRRWAIMAAFVAAPCLAISGQILDAAQALSSAAYRIVEKVGAPSGLSVRVHAGTYVLRITEVLGMGWACLAAYWASAAHLPSGTTAVAGAGGDAQ